MTLGHALIALLLVAVICGVGVWRHARSDERRVQQAAIHAEEVKSLLDEIVERSKAETERWRQAK